MLLIIFLGSLSLKANHSKDSAEVVTALENILSICKNVDFTDSNVLKLGSFYKAAPFIVYRGDDKNRSWKDASDYANEIEKKGVDHICLKINNTVNRDENYRIVGFRMETESEGTWYALKLTYMKNGVQKTAEFAFLKIKGLYLLGDID
ncbi:MAG: hypothetical protein H6605_07700 [Flavobacteriales bacterium]|nr:hypothetical protein [Flavobacteriales bacterium]